MSRKRNTLMMRLCGRLTMLALLLCAAGGFAEGTRLLRQPNHNQKHIVFSYGGDLWLSPLEGGTVRRLTSTAAVEKDPHLSPDGRLLAFTSNRSGVDSVYVMPISGGNPLRLTWYPASSRARGWTTDGTRILYASSRAASPSSYNRLWTVPVSGGPSTLLSRQWGFDGSFSPDGRRLVVDPISRWDVEWRAYRGGQNTALVIIDLEDQSEILLPNEGSMDIQPLWLGETIYFISDRDWTANIWSYSVTSGELKQISHYKGADIKWLSGYGDVLSFEREGYLHLMNLRDGTTRQLNLTVQGDFPWMDPRWEDVTDRVRNVGISPTGKRLLMEARGEIFTLPVEHGDTRNLTQSADAADRAALWSPKGDRIAWFSDQGHQGYRLFIRDQEGRKAPRVLSIGESKMAWEPVWSPDGQMIAFVDDDVRIRVLDLASGQILTADVGGSNLERGDNGLSWSPDSQWLAYAKSGDNQFRRIFVWSRKDGQVRPLTNSLADSFAPAWDGNGEILYFLASTDLALGSGWANTSSMKADPSYGVYLITLAGKGKSPFFHRSDEEPVAPLSPKKTDVKKKGDKDKKEPAPAAAAVNIQFDGCERRIEALPMPVRHYQALVSGPKGTLFILEGLPEGGGTVLHKFTLESRKSSEFIKAVRNPVISSDAKTLVYRQGDQWFTCSSDNPKSAKAVQVSLKMRVDRLKEWRQIFEEAYRYQRDYFYDPGMHGRNWDEVYKRYSVLVPFLRHRDDLNYILDMCNGELSVGHSFVFGGDMPKTERPSVGLLGADLLAESSHWKIGRIYTSESWNPKLAGPLDQPGQKVSEGQYLVGVNGRELRSDEDPYRAFDGCAGVLTELHINDRPQFSGSWTVTVKPIASESALRQIAWVEDNRRMVERLSKGKLAYVWVPNTGSGGFVSFNRYYFAQQDKLGAVIDERFNGGGLLDDYMVDLMTRTLRAGLTNEVPGGKPFRLPAGILGPKVLLINEMAGSGGDFFPWVFRQQKVGPLIGRRTWGGLVKSSVHYSLVDGGALTAPDNAVFDPHSNTWVAENKGVPPDIELRQDARSLWEGRDPQLERAVSELLRQLEEKPAQRITPPPFSTPAQKK